jgi:hypothetical protein
VTDRRLDRLELDLADLARAVDWPPTPDLATSVRVRLATAGGRAAEPRRPWLPMPRLTRPLLIAFLLLAIVAAVAAAIAFGLPGLRITFTSDPLPTPNVPAATATVAGTARPSPTAARAPGADLGLGTPTTLESVRARVDFPIVLPEIAGRAEPDGVYLEVLRGAELVTAVWRAGPDLPPLRPDSDVGLLITQFRATLDDGLLEKVLRTGTKVEVVQVNGHRGFWISGAQHILWFRRPNGDSVETPVRLVGDTLAVEVDGRIARIEANGGRDAVMRLAETLR